ncbi:mechanosensitive ion channel protein [Psychromonas sp. MB-3u-54]|uniref:mechanosensitive ion channel family protein n=1 Tax=Psychromonas sp. MB-3u-54 TaxID=2058319 RepID=UPI000C331BC0|nr:mechanosensitive ion channel domain-containing protein [Psychromonas sp. MB-3u-54]PKH04158.1 mechanosensitive ion channel protein [Psychromonas sp. MB-3u-54]
MKLEDLLNVLNYPTISIVGQTITVGQWLIVPLVLFIGYLLTKGVTNFISKRMLAKNMDPNQIHLIRRIIYVLAISILLITVLDLINVPIAAFAFLSGAIAIGFGFGAQNIINNFISGWILMWEQPIRIGDYLEVDNAKGVVEEINTRSTRIRRVDGVHLLIPNSKLLENTVVNRTLVDHIMRTSVSVGVAYGSPAKQVAALIMRAAKEQSIILENPPPVVTFEDFSDNSLVFEVNFWINATIDGSLRAVRSNVRFRLDELFAEHNIVVAFPQRDLHIDGSLTLLKNPLKVADEL